MKRHIAILVLFGSVVCGTAVFAQQRSGAPTPAPAPQAQVDEQLRQAQDLLQRMRSTPNMPETDRMNTLRELERLMVNLQRLQDSVGRLVAPVRVQALPVITAQPINPDIIEQLRLIPLMASLNGGQLSARRVTRLDGATSAWWTNTALLTRLGISDDQKLRIERTFEAHKQNLTTSKDQLEKEESQLDKLLAADSLDRGGITTQINRVVQARGEMERINSLMTLEMREVLTKAQWTQLQAQSNPNGAVYALRTPLRLSVAPPPAPAPPAAPGLRGGARGGGQRGPAPAPAQQ